MEAFDVLVELSELDTQPRHRIPSTAHCDAPRDALAPEALSHEDIAAARTLVRQAYELLRFSRSPWESPFYQDPVLFIEQLTLALERTLARLAQIDDESRIPVAVYDRTDVEPA
jgi:hypothetical protein